MISNIKKEVERRGITRLCHFTPSRNLVHIMTGERGILATKNLKEDERSVFTPTDIHRFDRHECHICCSIEYPNAWYFDKAKSRDDLFKDWVVIFINPKYLWFPGTRFSAINAASNHAMIVEGEQGFFNMFVSSTTKATRSLTHLDCCPTDNQAEVLISNDIGLSDILAIVVPTETQAKKEAARLDILGIPHSKYKFVIISEIFDKYKLKKLISSGKRPKETLWTPCN
ncbi:MAG: DUF4433 domain-containing protein [Rivularia sp. (in: Bacteria)]|nr:DUF4433 domain-containing protein [Rivularia sp. MS3]